MQEKVIRQAVEFVSNQYYGNQEFSYIFDARLLGTRPSYTDKSKFSPNHLILNLFDFLNRKVEAATSKELTRIFREVRIPTYSIHVLLQQLEKKNYIFKLYDWGGKDYNSSMLVIVLTARPYFDMISELSKSIEKLKKGQDTVVKMPSFQNYQKLSIMKKSLKLVLHNLEKKSMVDLSADLSANERMLLKSA